MAGKQPSADSTRKSGTLPLVTRLRILPRPVPRARWVSPAVLVLAITLLGTALRLYQIEARSFWFDELVSAYPVRLHTLDEVLAFVNNWTDWTPLGYIMTWLLRGLGGTETAVRLPFALAGILNIPALYLLGKTLARPRAGLIAALLMAVAPYAVYYSQEARPYTLLMLFTTLQMLFAYRAVAARHLWDWGGLALCSSLNLYTSYLALAPTAVVGAFVGLAGIGEAAPSLFPSLRRSGRVYLSPRQVAQLGCMAGGTVALVVLSYLPWLPHLQDFLTQPHLGFGRLPATYQPTWDDVQRLLTGFGLSGLWLALLGAGVLISARALVRGRRRAGLLLILWLGLPFGGFWFRAGAAILRLEVRYFAFWFPLAVLLITLALDEIAIRLGWWLSHRGTHLLPQRGWRRPAPSLVYVLTLTLVLAAAVGPLIDSYSRPKSVPQDYRAVAERIMTESAPGSLVLVMGMWGVKPAPMPMPGPVAAPSQTVDGIEYYLWLHQAPIAIVDGSLLEESLARRAEQANAQVWGVVYGAGPLPSEQQQQATAAGLDVLPFSGVTLIKPQRGSPSEQIKALLRWATPLEAGLVAPRSLLDLDFQRSSLGDTLLPAPSVAVTATYPMALPAAPALDAWALWPGTNRSPDQQAFVLHPGAQPEVNVTLTSQRITPGPVYVIRFRCHNAALQGSQRVYVSAFDAQDQFLDTYPYGAGYECAPAQREQPAAFAFRLPATTTQVVIWLRARGTGEASFDQVAVQAVLGQDGAK